MVKKKKISRFRELYNVIESLLDSYTFEDVTKLLKDDYDLSLSTGTLKNYVYQHRQYLSNLAVESEKPKINNDSTQSNLEVVKNLENKNSVEDFNNVEDVNSSSDDDDEFEAAIERAKQKVNNKSILNRR